MEAVTYLRKGDLVQVCVGRERGKTGKILRVDPKKARVFVERLNMVKKHLKPSKGHPQGGIMEKEAAVRWANVMLVCGKCLKPVRIRQRIAKDGTKGRICVKCGERIGA